ncbi:MAG: efflux RND transporter permease subunit, partial [Alphaproteobacteria bacterium]
MRHLIKASIDNPVLVNILMATVIIVGLFAFFDLPRELVSEVKFNWVFIIAPYPGASSEEVEQLVTIPIEEEIQDVRDIEEIYSASGEGSAFIMVKFGTISDDLFRMRYLDLKAEVDQVRELPEEVDDIYINEFDTTEMIPLVTINIGGPLTELELRHMATELRRRVMQISGVAKAELTGTHERQVWVELEPEKVEAHGVTPEMVSLMLNLANRNVPAGQLTAGREEFLLRTTGRFSDAERIGNVIVRSMPGGNALTVGDLATVTDGFEERRTLVHLNSQPSVSINVSKRSEASTIDIIEDVRALVKEVQRTLPAGTEIVLSGDTSVQIKDIMDVLRNNAFLGLLLVIIFLYLAIGARNAAFVAIGIPVTFLSTFIFMYYTHNSLNGNSLFGLILVLGVVVDDAIIIVENCYRHYQMGKPLKQAALEGAHEVAAPVLSATATTVAAFLPLMLMPGIMGKFMRIIPIVVCLVLAASMVEAFVILPSHFAEWSRKTTKPIPSPKWLRSLSRWYNHMLARLLRRRGWVLVALVLMIVGAVMISSNSRRPCLVLTSSTSTSPTL